MEVLSEDSVSTRRLWGERGCLTLSPFLWV